MLPNTEVSKSKSGRCASDGRVEVDLATGADEAGGFEAAAPGVEAEADDFIEPDGEIEPAVLSPEDDDLLILSPLSDEFDEKVAEAQEQLLHLRHQQEQLEKQKAELEELKRKREKFLRGRAEATDRLTKASAMFEREMFEAQKRLGQFRHAREAFERHLKNLEEINPDNWAREEMRSELSRALAAIQDARDEYTTEMARIGAIADLSSLEAKPVPMPVEVRSEKGKQAAVNPSAATLTPAAPATELRDFMYWLKSGFAFTLPLLVFGIFALFLVLVVF